LQAALDAGGTVHVCTGSYQGTFSISKSVTLIGAGDSDAPGANTILDANSVGRVLQINAAAGTVELQRLRLTRGNVGSDGAGIAHLGTLLRMSECTVSGNTAVNSSGGGIFVSNDSELRMTRCTVRDNKATGTGSVNGGAMYTQGTTTMTDSLIENNDASAGGGLLHHDAVTTLEGSTRVHDNHANIGGGFYVQGGTLTIARTCRVTENTAVNSNLGGGIYTQNGTVVLQGPDDPSPIVVDNCHENCAGQAVARCSTVPPDSCTT
jgi:parallel beta-helix repeat protein